MTTTTNAQRQQWRRDPVAFIREVLRDPETGAPFVLYPEQERFLREAFTPDATGRLRYPEILFGAPKKSGKTTMAAMVLLYVIIALGGPYAEGYVLANDFEQSVGRVWTAAARIVEASPLLRHSARITGNKITFKATGATITAIASEYASAAGANPTITVFDELWGYVSERSHRLFDEMIPVPTRKVSVRLTVTYAGFSGESDLLESLHRRGLAGDEIAPDLHRSDRMLCYWTNSCPAPWQDQRWLDQMREQLRPNAYLRLIENRWVTSESTFIDPAWWDACVNWGWSPVPRDPSLPVWAGVDASVKHDSTAIVACSYDQQLKKVRLVWHRVFQPSPNDPLDFESTIERALLDLHGRFRLREVRYDPFQMVSSAQRLQKAGLPMSEFPQSVPNLTEASSNLYELVRGRNLILYPDDAMRKSALQAVALEGSRGWRIAKEKQSHRIDVIVALAQAALGAVQQAGAVSSVGTVHNLFTGRRISSSQEPTIAPSGSPNECAKCGAIIGLNGGHEIEDAIGGKRRLCALCFAGEGGKTTRDFPRAQ